MFCIIYILRLCGGVTEFIGFSSLYNYVQTINIWQPFSAMHDDLSSVVKSFTDSVADFGNITDLGSFFQVLGNFIPNLFQIIILPVHIVWYIAQFVVNFVYEIFRFFSFMVGFDLSNMPIV